MTKSDRDWEHFAQQDPYYSVITQPEFRNAADNEQAKAKFFETGRLQVEGIFQRLNRWGEVDPSQLSVLDFGCGVGRLVLPFAKRCSKATGVDVAESMLSEARRNIERFGLDNASVCRLEEIDENQGFDLINSYIVFQHIPIKDGMAALRLMLNHLNPGGYISLHFTFAQKGDRHDWVWRLRSRFPWLYRFRSFKSLFTRQEPVMQMNRYEMNDVLAAVESAGIPETELYFTVHGGDVGAHIYGQKKLSDLPPLSP